MQRLQCPYIYLASLEGRDSFCGCPRCRNSSEGGNARYDRGAPDRAFIEPRLKSSGGVDDKMNALALDKVHHVRTPLFYLVDAIDFHARSLNHVGCARCSDQLETHIHKLARNLGNVALVVVGNADEHSPLRWQLLARGQLCFCEGFV